MGNKLLKNNTVQEESPDEIYILLHINNPNGIVTKRLTPTSSQNSNAGNFRYYNVSKYLYEMINEDYSYTLMIYKGQSQTDKRVFIDSRYRQDKERYITSENVILKKRYYDIVPCHEQQIILRHNDNMNLTQIIIKGNMFGRS